MNHTLVTQENLFQEVIYKIKPSEAEREKTRGHAT